MFNMFLTKTVVYFFQHLFTHVLLYANLYDENILYPNIFRKNIKWNNSDYLVKLYIRLNQLADKSNLLMFHDNLCCV